MQKSPVTKAFWALCAYLATVYLTGGSARDDVQSLVILRPVSIVFFGFAAWNCSNAVWRHNRILISLAIGALAINAIYIVPLPESIYTALGEREFIRSIDVSVFGQAIGRTLAVNPHGAWNALFAMMVPLTALVLAIQIDRQERQAIMVLLAVLGLASGLLGLLQSIGDHRGSLYFYEITNNGSAVGLLSNRNHQAVLIASLFPMLAAYAATGADASQSQFRGWLAIVASAFLVPLILVVGSRAGFILSAFAMLASLWLYRQAVPARKLVNEKSRSFEWRLPAIGAGIIILAFTTLSLSRAKALQRIIGPEENSQNRSDFWQSAIQVALDHFYIGTGPGGFVQANIAEEADKSLSFTFLNHVHNDWLELVLTYGVTTIALLGALVIAMIVGSIRIIKNTRRPHQPFKAIGIVVLTIILAGSIVDYPLRAPLIATLAAVAAVWCFPSYSTNSKNSTMVGKGWNHEDD